MTAASSPSVLPEVSGCHTGGATRQRLLSFPPLCTERGVGSDPRLKKILMLKFVCKRQTLFHSHQRSYSIFFPFSLTQLDTSFLDSLLPLQSYGKNHSLQLHTSSFYPTFLSSTPWTFQLVQPWVFNNASVHYLQLLQLAQLTQCSDLWCVGQTAVKICGQKLCPFGCQAPIKIPVSADMSD